jgi:hypothetical protein
MYFHNVTKVDGFICLMLHNIFELLHDSHLLQEDEMIEKEVKPKAVF